MPPAYDTGVSGAGAPGRAGRDARQPAVGPAGDRRPVTRAGRGAR